MFEFRGKTAIFATDMDYRIYPPEELIETTVHLPLTKSGANRALAIAALTPGGKRPSPLPDCDDCRAMLAALDGDSDEINIGGAGTAMRFLTAVFAASAGVDIILDGNERMRRRPIGPLVEALRACGAEIEYTGEEGYPPLHIVGHCLHGGTVEMDASTSSQFASALLMAGPTMAHGLHLALCGKIVSEPYVRMTVEMMREAGAEVERMGESFIVSPGGYKGGPADVSADWSAAAFWYEIEALSSGFITLDNLSLNSKQPDRAGAALFEQLGVETGQSEETPGLDLIASPDLSPRLYYDFSDVPDMVPAVTVACCMLRVPFRFSGLETLRIKESDRIAALMEELGRLGIDFETNTAPDELAWEGKAHPVGELPVFDCHDDHRMAMALAPIALYVPGIVIRGAECVSKSYPGFWNDLRAAGFTLADPQDGQEEER